MLYPVAIEKGDAAHAFGAIVPDIPGCYSAGDTFEEALVNAQEAIASHLEILCEDGAEIPQAKSVNEYYGRKDYKGYVWAMVDVDITPFLGKSEKINVTLPSLLIKQIDSIAGAAVYKTRSGFLATAAINELNKLKSSH